MLLAVVVVVVMVPLVFLFAVLMVIACYFSDGEDICLFIVAFWKRGYRFLGADIAMKICASLFTVFYASSYTGDRNKWKTCMSQAC